jgi:flagellar hook assembly protein FlgD
LKIEDLELTNYPNPFNPSTTISFNLNADDAKDAKIEIYNLKGQKVKTLPVILSGVEGSANHQIIKSQNHQIVWNGRDENNKPVGSGVYFYKLKAGKLKKTKKMLLIK